MSRIEQIIDEIESYIDDCKPAAFSSSKIAVNREELEELLTELRLQIPEEVKLYQKIISNQDAIMNQAKAQAEGMVNEANKLQSQMIDEHEIMQKAYANANSIIENANVQAENILANATADANSMKRSVINYSDEMLGALQKILEHTIGETKQKYDSFLNSMESSLDIVTKNKKELSEANGQS